MLHANIRNSGGKKDFLKGGNDLKKLYTPEKSPKINQP